MVVSDASQVMIRRLFDRRNRRRRPTQDQLTSSISAQPMKHLLLSVIAASTFAFAFTSAEAQEPSTATASKGVWVKGGQLYVIIPADRKSICAFSTATSKLSRVTLDDALPADVFPSVASKVAAVQAGRTVFAIGISGNRWGRLDLPEDGLSYAIDDESVRVSNDDLFYVFGPGSTDWSGIDLRSGELITP